MNTLHHNNKKDDGDGDGEDAPSIDMSLFTGITLFDQQYIETSLSQDNNNEDDIIGQDSKSLIMKKWYKEYYNNLLGYQETRKKRLEEFKTELNNPTASPMSKEERRRLEQEHAQKETHYLRLKRKTVQQEFEPLFVYSTAPTKRSISPKQFLPLQGANNNKVYRKSGTFAANALSPQSPDSIDFSIKKNINNSTPFNNNNNNNNQNVNSTPISPMNFNNHHNSLNGRTFLFPPSPTGSSEDLGKIDGVKSVRFSSDTDSIPTTPPENGEFDRSSVRRTKSISSITKDRGGLASYTPTPLKNKSFTMMFKVDPKTKLEQTEKLLQEKEEDTRVAAEIGKELLDRNEELESELRSLRSRTTDQQQQLSQLEAVRKENDRLRTEVLMLGSKIDSATTENANLIENETLLQEQLHARSQWLRSEYSPQRAAVSQKNEQIELLKMSVENLQSSEDRLKKNRDRLASQNEMLTTSVADLQTMLAERVDATEHENLKQKIKTIRVKNRELRSRITELESKAGSELAIAEPEILLRSAFQDLIKNEELVSSTPQTINMRVLSDARIMLSRLEKVVFNSDQCSLITTLVNFLEQESNQPITNQLLTLNESFESSDDNTQDPKSALYMLICIVSIHKYTKYDKMRLLGSDNTTIDEMASQVEALKKMVSNLEFNLDEQKNLNQKLEEDMVLLKTPQSTFMSMADELKSAGQIVDQGELDRVREEYDKQICEFDQQQLANALEIESLKLQLERLQSSMQDRESQLDTVQKELQAKQLEIVELNKLVQSSQLAFDDQKKELEATQSRELELLNDLDKLLEQLANAKSMDEERSKSIQQLNTSYNELVNDKQSLVEQLDQLKSLIRNHLDSIDQLNNDKKDLNHQIDQLNNERLSFIQQIDQLNNEKNVLQQSLTSQLDQFNNEKMMLQQEIDQSNNDKQLLQLTIDGLNQLIKDKQSVLDSNTSDSQVQLNQLKQQLVQLENENQSLKLQLNKLEKEKLDSLNDNQSLRQQIDQLENEKNLLTQQLDQSNTNIDQLNGDKSSLTKQLDQSNIDKQSLQFELDKSNNDKQSLQKDIDQLNTDKSSLQKDIDQLNNDKSSLVQQLDQSNTDNQSLQKDIDQLNNEKNLLTQQLDQLNTNIDQLNSDKSSLTKQLDQSNIDKQSLQKDIDQLNNDKSSLTKQLDQSNIDKQSLQLELNEFIKVNNDQKEEINRLTKEVEELKNKIQELQQSIDSMTNNNDDKSNQQQTTINKMSIQIDQLNIELIANKESINQLNNQLQQKIQENQLLVTKNDEHVVLIKSINMELDQIKLENGELKSLIEKATKDQQELNTKITGLIQEMDQVKLELKNTIDQLKEANEKNQGLEKEIDHLKQEIVKIQGQDDRDEMIDKLQRDMEELVGQKNSLVADHVAATSGLTAKIKSLEIELEGAQESVDALQRVEAMSDWVEGTRLAAEKAMDVCNSKLEELSNKLNKISEVRLKDLQELDDRQTKITGLQAEVNHLKDKVDQLITEMQTERENTESLVTENHQLREEIKELKLRLENKTRKHQAVKELSQQLEDMIALVQKKKELEEKANVDAVTKPDGEKCARNYESEEEGVIVQYINSHLVARDYISHVFPIDLQHHILGSIYDGVLLCELVNFAREGTIDDRVMNVAPRNQIEVDQNFNLVTNSARAIGCKIINSINGTNSPNPNNSSSNSNVTPQLIREDGVVAIGLMYELVRVHIMSTINVVSYPNLLVLKGADEDIKHFLAQSAQQLLRRWVLYHLDIKKTKLTLEELVLDEKNLIKFLTSLDKELVAPSSDIDPYQWIIDQSNSRFNIFPWLSIQSLTNKNQKLALLFIASLFVSPKGGIAITAVESAKEEAVTKAVLEVKNFLVKDVEGTREERAFCMWLNSLNINPFVNNLQQDLQDGLVILQMFDKIKSGSVNWKSVNLHPSNTYMEMENCNYAIDIAKKFKFSLVGIDGKDIHDGNRKLTLALIWQACKYHLLSILSSLWAQGKELTDADIIRWANQKVTTIGKSSGINNFKDPSIGNGLFLIDLLESVSRGAINYSIVQQGDSDEEKKANAQYIINIARKLDCCIFLVHEDIVQVRPKMILTLVAQLYIKSEGLS